MKMPFYRKRVDACANTDLCMSLWWTTQKPAHCSGQMKMWALREGAPFTSAALTGCDCLSSKINTEIARNTEWKHCQFVFVSQYCQSCQSLDFPSLLRLHIPSTASAHVQNRGLPHWYMLRHGGKDEGFLVKTKKSSSPENPSPLSQNPLSPQQTKTDSVDLLRNTTTYMTAVSLCGNRFIIINLQASIWWHYMLHFLCGTILKLSRALQQHSGLSQMYKCMVIWR